MTERNKRMVVISDLHAGHVFGLTPPGWWFSGDTDAGALGKVKHFQRELWNFYQRAIESLKPIDILICNGDAVEGKGWRSGGMELITADRHEQTRMAKAAIEIAEAQKVRVLLGTPYHVGDEEHFEHALVDILDAPDKKFGIQEFFNINGTIMHIKHKVGSSAIPHGRYTALARARMWNTIWHAEHERQPQADILVRSHVHYHVHCGGPSWLGMITPALTYNSIFGKRDCEGLVDVGFVYFDFAEDGSYSWRAIMADFAKLKVTPESL